jgi:hypothetical protein
MAKSCYARTGARAEGAARNAITFVRLNAAWH